MISRIVMLSPYDQKCDDEYDQPEKHPAQQGTECFGYGHGIGGVGHKRPRKWSMVISIAISTRMYTTMQ
jgi:hypothetical protein